MGGLAARTQHVYTYTRNYLHIERVCCELSTNKQHTLSIHTHAITCMHACTVNAYVNGVHGYINACIHHHIHTYIPHRVRLAT